MPFSEVRALGTLGGYAVRKMISTAAVTFIAAIFGSQAEAALAYHFDFDVLSVTCDLPSSTNFDRGAECARGASMVFRGMDDVSVTLDDDAARRGTARLEVVGGPPFGSEVVLNEGFLAATAYDGVNLMGQGPLQGAQVDLLVSIFLQGRFDWGGTQHDFHMATSGDSPLWSGRFSSDALIWSGSFPMRFTGEFRLVDVLTVPEPATGLLTATALAGMLTLVGRRRKHHEKGSK
jgi:hypothetical protein